MAATIAIARGQDNTRTKETHRLGSRSAEAEANTWHTFAKVETLRDGSGVFTLRRGSQCFTVRWNAEEDGLEILDASANFPWA